MALSSAWKNGPPPWELERIELGLDYDQAETEEAISLWVERYKVVTSIQNTFAKDTKRRILVY